METTFGGNDPHGTLMAYIDQMDDRLSDRTKQEYSTRLKEISKNLRHTGDTVTPDMLVEHVRNLVVSGQIASSSYRSYKSAITFWLGQQTRAVIEGGGNPSNYARAFDSLQSLKYAQTAPSSKRTSAKKLKYFPSECLDALTKYSEERGNRAPNAAKAAAFAKANLLVGLRPSEWFNATLASRLCTNSKGDITYIATDEGWLYLAAVIDLFSRQVVGWSLQAHMQSSLVTDALKMSWFRRHPAPGLIFHSDRGSQYCGHEFQSTLTGYKMRSSMSRKGNCWDNALTESLWGRLKVGRLYGQKFATRRDAMDEVIDWLTFYNHSRLHSTLGYVSPMKFEERWTAAQLLKAA